MTDAEHEVIEASRDFAVKKREQAFSPCDPRELTRRTEALRAARMRWDRACEAAFGVRPWDRDTAPDLTA